MTQSNLNTINNNSVHNVHIQSEQVLVTPTDLKKQVPLTEKMVNFISQSRYELTEILNQKDHRLLVITGPCSIHDIESAKDYANRLKNMQKLYGKDLFFVMRLYFEKPRTTIGWKGLINDPNLNGSFDIEKGLLQARELMAWLTELEIPIATEALDPISPQYLADLVTWSAIGARTTESQTHREMASGLSMPVGFKNGTDGNLDTAINAMQAASKPHAFMGMNQNGQISVLKTAGNPDGHIILRGGKKPNYESEDIAIAEQALKKAKQPARIVVDCSHGNSLKQHERQINVTQNIIEQIENGNCSILGIMLESHINAGNQPLKDSASELKYGVSITDACIDWQSSENLFKLLAEKLSSHLKHRINNRNE